AARVRRRRRDRRGCISRVPERADRGGHGPAACDVRAVLSALPAGDRRFSDAARRDQQRALTQASYDLTALIASTGAICDEACGWPNSVRRRLRESQPSLAETVPK